MILEIQQRRASCGLEVRYILVPTFRLVLRRVQSDCRAIPFTIRVNAEKKTSVGKYEHFLTREEMRANKINPPSLSFMLGFSVGRDYDIEIEGIKRETLRAQAEHEGLVAVRDRLESDRAFVDEQLAKTKVCDVQSFSNEFFP